MSDGPHKSLPMPAIWAQFAERAATSAYSIAEVLETLPYALSRDFKDVPLARIREALQGDPQRSLFARDLQARLDAVRQDCRGSEVSNAVIDSAIKAVSDGFSEDAALRQAVEDALRELAQSRCRQIEEHYLREDRRSAADIRNRLRDGLRALPYADLALQLISPASSSTSRRPRQRDGIDEGPEL